MKRLIIVLALLLAMPAHAGVMEVVCVAPVEDNDGSCDSVVSVPRRGNPPMTVHFTWMSTLRGGAAGHDSLLCAGGDTLAFSRWVPGGSYRTSLWAVDAGGRGCSTDTLRVVRGWPGKVRVVK